ncbi:COG4223 family protein [Rhodopseudomonas palustris]|uniref:Uncharacterized protein n=1 Tax=Rhodopseudomonas palustris (strain BisB18) TaxID=316056 RepID=Q21DA9_RHOPB
MVKVRPHDNRSATDANRSEHRTPPEDSQPPQDSAPAVDAETPAEQPAPEIDQQIAPQAVLPPGGDEVAPEAAEPAVTQQAEAAESERLAAESPSPVSEPAPRSPSIAVPALTGAVAAAIVVGAAWFALGPNLAPPPAAPVVVQNDNAALGALTARVAGVESKVAALSSAAATPAASAAPADATLAPRIDAVEKSIAALRDDFAAARTQSAQLSAAVNALKTAPTDGSAPAVATGETPAAVDLAPLNERLSQLEQAVKTPAPTIDLAPLDERLDKLERAATTPVAVPAAPDDTALRRVVAAMLLDVSVRQGEPYAGVLTVAKPLSPDAATLKPLDAFASTGVPSITVLARELVALLPKLAPGPSGPDSTASIIERLQAGADRMVRIQRPDAATAKDRGAIVARIAVAAQRSDLAEAVRELNLLEPADRAPAQPWLDKVAARDAALAVSRQFAAAAMAALPKKSP